MPVRALAFLVAAFFLIAPARAHTTDTSYARVRIFDDRLEIRLTLDIFTLQRIVPDIDANGDSALSREELRRATPAIQKFLREHVGIEVNEAASELGVAKDPFWPLDAPDPIPASAWHTNEALVSFGFDKPLASKPKTVALLFGVFGTLGDRHGVLGVFEYRGQTTEVIFTVAEPDYLFDVAYAVPAGSVPDAKAPPPPAKKTEPEAAPSAGSHRSNADDSPVWSYFKKGIEHILTGYDHLCFLLALLVVSRLRPLVGIITSFTIAHSITLMLASFEIVKLPSRFIECSVAVTIVYVGVENICRTKFAHRWMLTCFVGLILVLLAAFGMITFRFIEWVIAVTIVYIAAGNMYRGGFAHRWVLTFFFGLIHGFSFANTLNPQELPQEAKTKCLLVFNLGVEAGQLAVVLALLPLSLAIAKWKHGAGAKIAISVLVALLGLAWFLDRFFTLRLMPF
jgi:hypothetical protein